jgi:hypothetical protein
MVTRRKRRLPTVSRYRHVAWKARDLALGQDRRDSIAARKPLALSDGSMPFCSCAFAVSPSAGSATELSARPVSACSCGGAVHMAGRRSFVQDSSSFPVFTSAATGDSGTLVLSRCAPVMDERRARPRRPRHGRRHRRCHKPRRRRQGYPRDPLRRVDGARSRGARRRCCRGRLRQPRKRDRLAHETRYRLTRAADRGRRATPGTQPRQFSF